MNNGHATAERTTTTEQRVVGVGSHVYNTMVDAVGRIVAITPEYAVVEHGPDAELDVSAVRWNWRQLFIDSARQIAAVPPEWLRSWITEDGPVTRLTAVPSQQPADELVQLLDAVTAEAHHLAARVELALLKIEDLDDAEEYGDFEEARKAAYQVANDLAQAAEHRKLMLTKRQVLADGGLQPAD